MLAQIAVGVYQGDPDLSDPFQASLVKLADPFAGQETIWIDSQKRGEVAIGLLTPDPAWGVPPDPSKGWTGPWSPDMAGGAPGTVYARAWVESPDGQTCQKMPGIFRVDDIPPAWIPAGFTG